MSDLTNWRAEKVPHIFNDGTTHTWRVAADSYDCAGEKIDVELACWLGEDSARLIAAAPTLLEALKGFVDASRLLESPEGQQVTERLFAKATAAIALATGETK